MDSATDAAVARAAAGDGVERPALATNPKFVFFTDFDGTITLQDTNDYMTDHLGYGAALRQAGNADVLSGKRHFRDAFREMLDSIVTTPFSECIALLKQRIELDPKFVAFFEWAGRADVNVPIVILSGGMQPVIRGLLEHWLGAEAVRARLQIVSNDVAARPGKRLYEDAGGWQLVYHDDSSFGHDKSLEIRKYAQLPPDQRPAIFYAGDGVSDLSAAREADLMFAKAGRDLVTFCRRENVPYTEFRDFGDILADVRAIVEGQTTVAAVVARSDK